MYQAQLTFDQGEETARYVYVSSFKTQLLKWVGNKQRFANEIITCFPIDHGTYHEPFLGSGAILGTLAPKRAIASDACKPLMGIWRLLHDEPDRLALSYRRRWDEFMEDREATYERVKERFNQNHNAEDLFFLARSCYAGIIRFRKDGYMSTPVGPHRPITPESVENRIRIWRKRTVGTDFRCQDFAETMQLAKAGDLIYCDPPYADTQAILYGAQVFSLGRLYSEIAAAKERGVFVALSIDGEKRSGRKEIDVGIPDGLFETEKQINCGRSMLRRLQMEGQTLESELVADRLLLTWAAKA